MFRTAPGIKQFQLVQESIDALTARLVTDHTFKNSSLVDLEQRVQERCGAELRLNFELVDDIPPTKAGKRRFIISKIPMTFGNQ